jgi:hypothetical protein
MLRRLVEGDVNCGRADDQGFRPPAAERKIIKVFERGPFETCISCRAPESLGILSAGGDSVRRRCKVCRFSFNEALPPVDKKVVYLDQFAISELYKVKSQTRRQDAGNRQFWQDFHRLANRAYLLQQVIFPASNIHSDETIVSPFASDLGLAHEMMSGDTSFEDAHKIAGKHELAYAEAYLRKLPPPELSSDVDDILEGRRNDWLRDMHTSVNTDYSLFADGIRVNRTSAKTGLQALADKWAAEKPTFNDILNHELESYGSAHRGACEYSANLAKKALESDDHLGFVNANGSSALEQYRSLRRLFENSGIPKEQSHAALLNFREWPANRQLPTHRIFAYLMAAFGWKISCGQRRPIEAGIFNDFVAISTYGPYVDAMFVDKECAGLLTQGRVRTDVKLKAKVFSLQTRDEFLQYLTDLAASATKEVRNFATEIYDVS